MLVPSRHHAAVCYLSELKAPVVFWGSSGNTETSRALESAFNFPDVSLLLPPSSRWSLMQTSLSVSRPTLIRPTSHSLTSVSLYVVIPLCHSYFSRPLPFSLSLYAPFSRSLSSLFISLSLYIPLFLNHTASFLCSLYFSLPLSATSSVRLPQTV